MEQLSLFDEMAFPRSARAKPSLFLEWVSELDAHVYRDPTDPEWAGMSICLFQKLRGHERTCSACAPGVAKDLISSEGRGAQVTPKGSHLERG